MDASKMWWDLIVLSQVLQGFACKKYENPLRTDKVVDMSLVYYVFFRTRCTCIWTVSDATRR